MCVRVYEHTYIHTRVHMYTPTCVHTLLMSMFTWRGDNLYVVTVAVLKYTLNAILSPTWGAAANSGNRL